MSESPAWFAWIRRRHPHTPTRIVVAGLGKSGTTALFYALKQSLPANALCLFEPDTCPPLPPDRPVLVKILITPTVAYGDFDSFTRRILIVRDPRDNLISRLLYFGAYDSSLWQNEARARIFLEQLERKQRDPRSMPLMALFDSLPELTGAAFTNLFRQRLVEALAFDTPPRRYFVYRYEDFVTGRFAPLEKHLHLRITFDGRVDDEFRRVARTKSAGDWRNWLTPEDVACFEPLCRDYLARYGYDTDWTPSPNPQIAPAHGTDYARRLLAEKHAAMRAAATGQTA